MEQQLTPASSETIPYRKLAGSRMSLIGPPPSTAVPAVAAARQQQHQEDEEEGGVLVVMQDEDDSPPPLLLPQLAPPLLPQLPVEVIVGNIVPFLSNSRDDCDHVSVINHACRNLVLNCVDLPWPRQAQLYIDHYGGGHGQIAISPSCGGRHGYIACSNDAQNMIRIWNCQPSTRASFLDKDDDEDVREERANSILMNEMTKEQTTTRAHRHPRPCPHRFDIPFPMLTTERTTTTSEDDITTTTRSPTKKKKKKNMVIADMSFSPTAPYLLAISTHEQVFVQHPHYGSDNTYYNNDDNENHNHQEHQHHNFGGGFVGLLDLRSRRPRRRPQHGHYHYRQENWKDGGQKIDSSQRRCRCCCCGSSSSCSTTITMMMDVNVYEILQKTDPTSFKIAFSPAAAKPLVKSPTGPTTTGFANMDNDSDEGDEDGGMLCCATSNEVTIWSIQIKKKYHHKNKNTATAATTYFEEKENAEVEIQTSCLYKFDPSLSNEGLFLWTQYCLAHTSMTCHHRRFRRRRLGGSGCGEVSAPDVEDEEDDRFVALGSWSRTNQVIQLWHLTTTINNDKNRLEGRNTIRVKDSNNHGENTIISRVDIPFPYHLNQLMFSPLTATNNNRDYCSLATLDSTRYIRLFTLPQGHCIRSIDMMTMYLTFDCSNHINSNYCCSNLVAYCMAFVPPRQSPPPNDCNKKTTNDSPATKTSSSDSCDNPRRPEQRQIAVGCSGGAIYIINVDETTTSDHDDDNGLVAAHNSSWTLRRTNHPQSPGGGYYCVHSLQFITTPPTTTPTSTLNTKLMCICLDCHKKRPGVQLLMECFSVGSSET